MHLSLRSTATIGRPPTEAHGSARADHISHPLPQHCTAATGVHEIQALSHLGEPSPPGPINMGLCSSCPHESQLSVCPDSATAPRARCSHTCVWLQTGWTITWAITSRPPPAYTIIPKGGGCPMGCPPPACSITFSWAGICNFGTPTQVPCCERCPPALGSVGSYVRIDGHANRIRVTPIVLLFRCSLNARVAFALSDLGFGLLIVTSPLLHVASPSRTGIWPSTTLRALPPTGQLTGSTSQHQQQQHHHHQHSACVLTHRRPSSCRSGPLPWDPSDTRGFDPGP